MVFLKLSRMRSRRNLLPKREPQVRLLGLCKWQFLKEGSQRRFAIFDLIGQAEPMGNRQFYRNLDPEVCRAFSTLGCWQSPGNHCNFQSRDIPWENFHILKHLHSDNLLRNFQVTVLCRANCSNILFQIGASQSYTIPYIKVREQTFFCTWDYREGQVLPKKSLVSEAITTAGGYFRI